MVCIKNTNCIIIGNEMTLSDCKKLITDVSDEVYLIPGGYQIKGIMLKGSRPFPVGFSGGNLFFQYVKPCFGIFALQIENCHKDITLLREDFIQNNFEKIK
ncbi:DUF1894 domain-containing protein [Methanolapillus ohkumae]|uniref:DUF1894 domain-containing protein n=1 Tax=Methanolapillus ohkumae TaxID=3028298 RepID=A0AA96ZV75_9EURY|nr:hypothetical protein MsAm2_01800 [Methanosarcinaceae archaeon Am2]